VIEAVAPRENGYAAVVLGGNGFKVVINVTAQAAGYVGKGYLYYPWLVLSFLHKYDYDAGF